ncbi:MAG TPA: TonB family protein [Pyrinomonadaceae bacterium]|nr:TonB family protein [Pyrinomonadaceae bacterium]
MSKRTLILAASLCLLSHALHAQAHGQTPAASGANTSDKSTSSRPSELQEADQISASVAQLYAAGKYKEALPLAERALALREKVLQDEDPLVGVALHNLAMLYIARGDAGKAEPLCERILARRVRGQSPTSEATLNVLAAYACIVSARGRIQVRDKPPLTERINNILLQDAIAATGLKLPASLEGVGAQVSKPPPQYPVEARSRRLQGSIFVVLEVDETGKVLSAEPLPCVPGLKVLGKAASEAARRSSFAPISIAGRPIRRKAFAIYNFVLR